MWANKTLEKAAANEVWKLHRWITGHRNYPLPAISRGPGQSPATKKSVKLSEQPSIKNLPLFLPPSKLTYHVDKIMKFSLRKSLTQRFRKLSLH